MVTCKNWDVSSSWVTRNDYIACIVNFLINELSLDSHSHILDIGCARANIISALAKQLYVKNPIEGIDISDTIIEAPICDGIKLFQKDAISYLETKADNSYDCIILKGVFHCIPEYLRLTLLEQIYRCLRLGKRAVILMMPAEPVVPLFERAKETFRAESLTIEYIQELANKCCFQTEENQLSYDVLMTKEDYFNLLKIRFMSNLRMFSDQEIAEGILELDELYPGHWLEFQDRTQIIKLLK
ncbi:MAG: class I SAM-dependent methyltransferase [Microcoleus sp.]